MPDHLVSDLMGNPKSPILRADAEPAAEIEFGCWFGTHLGLWKQHGSTPLWLVFSDTAWGRGALVRSSLEPWALQHGNPSVWRNETYSIGIHVETGLEEEAVMVSVVDQFRQIWNLISELLMEGAA